MTSIIFVEESASTLTQSEPLRVIKLLKLPKPGRSSTILDKPSDN